MTPQHRRIVKRGFDVVVSVIALVLLAPLLLVVTVVSLLAQGPPLLYVSPRFVAPGRAVRIYKFRTMVRDAKSAKYALAEQYMRDGYLDIPVTSEVYTPIGQILERTQLVEVPQIANVLFDGLSWVGNRALPLENIQLLGKFEGWEERFDSPCGLTGASQIVGKGRLSPLQRITLERRYAQVYKHGDVLRADVAILLATARLVFTGRACTYAQALKLLDDCLARPRRERDAA